MKIIPSLEPAVSQEAALEGPLTAMWSRAIGVMTSALVVVFIVSLLAFCLSLIEAVITERLSLHDVFGVQEAQAAEFATEKTMGSIHVAMTAGEQKTVTFGFKNLGSSTWTREGWGYISLYTYGPKYRKSVFEDASWRSSSQVVRLMEDYVAPGEVGHVEFVLHAPDQPGQYYETFHLASENTAWIPGGELTLNIPVSAPDGQTQDAVPSPVSAEGLSAMILLRSSKSVSARGGERVDYTVGIKNTGTSSWANRSIRTPDIGLASTIPDTYHASWVSSTKLVSKSEPVAPGELDFVNFTFTAPKERGSYVIRYVLDVNGTVVPDFFIDIPVEVTSNAPEVIDDPKRDDIDEGDLIEEPMIRVGVLIVDEETDWQVEVSCQSDWELRAGSGALLAEMNGGEMVRAFYKPEEMKYYFNRGKGLEKTSDYLRFVPKEKNSICTIENFDRRVTRNFTHPDNTFRNILEIRYNDTKKRTWMINELPMEYYLRGLAETSNYSHEEFQKALITIARTYALYHWERGTKRGAEFFHVTAYADDQVYNGYGQEQRAPRLTEAVEATRGVVVTYDGKTAITPYFSRSDGRTRDWSEVWAGEVPWAKSVPVPCDEGKTLWGHGVGLSASGALCMANEGETWDEILKYFYQGIDLKRHWK